MEDPAALIRAAGDRPVIGHDVKALGEVPANLTWDTEVAAYLLDPARRGYPLDELCEERGMAVEADDPEAARAVLAHELAGRQRDQVRERGLEGLLREIELPLVRVLRETEKAGIKLDTHRLEQAGLRMRADAAELEREIWELAGEEFMIGSPQQLAEVLFGKLGLSRKRRGKTGFSTDARVLQAIRDEHPIVSKIERWREVTKLVQTYLEQLPAAIGPDGRLHTTLLQTNTSTGRLASINPNLQNIPIRTEIGREIRACFIAEPGNVLISVDYSQVELRVLAHIAGEDVLKQIFLRGEDVHTETAAAVFDTAPDALTVGMRSKAKMVNYGIVYGLSAYGLADRLRIEQEEAQEFIDRYLERFPAVARFMADAVKQAEEHGYVSTLFGRRRQIPEIRARNWQTRKLGERLAVNTVIQGTAADIIKVAMVRCHDRLAAEGLATRMILQIHDELLFEGPQDEARARGRGRVRGDGRGGGDGSAAGGRRGHRPQLAGREVTTAEAAAAPAAAARRESLLLLAALLLAAVALRPQLVGAGPLIPDIQDDLGTSHAVAGLVGTIPVLCMGLFAPLAGLLSARWGLRAAMAGCLLAIAVAGVGRALSPGIAVLLALTLPVGVAMAVAGTLLPVAVKQRFAHRPAFANGIGVTGINIGAAISSAVAVPIASAAEGWRGALAAFSLATLADLRRLARAEPRRLEERAGGARRGCRCGARSPGSIMLAFALPSVVYYGLVAWIADAYQERGWSDAASGAVLAVMGDRLDPGRADRPMARRPDGHAAVVDVVRRGLHVLATFGFAAIAGGGYVWAVLTGVALGTVFPICLTMCLDVARGPADAGAAAALMFLAGYPVAALGPLGVGALRDLTARSTRACGRCSARRWR